MNSVGVRLNLETYLITNTAQPPNERNMEITLRLCKFCISCFEIPFFIYS